MNITNRPRPLASIVAVAAGLVLVAALSMSADHLFHALGLYPPLGEPMFDPALNLLALAYRIVFALAGGYLVARLAPNAPMGHVLVLGLIGACLATMGAIASIPMQLGPAWLPIVLAVSALPLTWLGGSLAMRTPGERA